MTKLDIRGIQEVKIIMDKTYDFSNDRRAHITFGGSDRKFGVIHNGQVYMLKFSENHAKKSDISTSYPNHVISEYISSHIAASTGLPVHETVLGTYNEELVVGCKDFRENGESNIEFSEYIRAKYESKDNVKPIKLYQIYDTLKAPESDIPLELQNKSIERYWDTFVVDSLVGNFDRHIGNWGYLVKNNELKLSPIYDFGSTLLPRLSDEGIMKFHNDQMRLYERTLVFPSPALAITEQKVGKIGYYDMLSSNFDKNCTEAVLRIVPKVDIDKIKNIIDETPYITDVRKEFYKDYLQTRKELILDRAYLRCFYKEFDKNAYERMITGHQFSKDDLKTFISDRNKEIERFQYIEKLLNKRFSRNSDRYSLINIQRDLMQKYGFRSQHVWNETISKDSDKLSQQPTT